MSERPSAWAPLRRSPFRLVWPGIAIGQIVTWMHLVGAATVIERTDGTALEMSLVQSAISLPIVFLGVWAGALADVVGSRPVMMVAQVLMLVALASLGVLTVTGTVNPLLVLLVTLAVGMSNALTNPSFQSLVPRMVPRSEITLAIALNSVAINVARIVGPAVAGLLLIMVGAGSLFFIEAALVLVALLLFLNAPRVVAACDGPRERIVSAMLLGLRHARFSPEMRAVIALAVLFTFSGSALLGLLPVVGFRQLELTSFGVGVLFACLGGGALVGLHLQPLLREWFSIDRIVVFGSVVVALTYLVLAFVGEPVLVGLCLIPCGAAWTNVMSIQMSAAQFVVPDWVRARALAIFLAIQSAALGLGAALWGAITVTASIEVALVTAHVGMLLGLLGRLRWSLARATSLDLRTVLVPTENVAVTDGIRGPVWISREYVVAPSRHDEFVQEMQALKELRRRNGARKWSLHEEVSREDVFVESYLVASWAQHVRQGARMTAADAEVVKRAEGFHIGEASPATRVFTSPNKTRLQR